MCPFRFEIASFPPASEFRNSETRLSPAERDDGGQITRNDLSINAFVLVSRANLVVIIKRFLRIFFF